MNTTFALETEVTHSHDTNTDATLGETRNDLFTISDIFTEINNFSEEEPSSVDYSMSCILLFISASIAFGNSLVVASVMKYPTLQTTSNIYILFLACADLVVAASLPYSAAFVLNRSVWQRSFVGCMFRYVFMIQSISTSSILHVGKSFEINIFHLEIVVVYRMLFSLFKKKRIMAQQMSSYLHNIL